MNRRHFILSGAAAALAGGMTGRGRAARAFAPTRFSVGVSGAGPDVIMIPGLTSGRGIWASAVRAVPGYRYHLVQVAGFDGEPARGNARGAMIAPLAAELVRYIEDRGLRRPAIIGHSMGGTLALMLAAERPRLVGKAMVVDILPAPAGLFGGSAGLGSVAGGLFSTERGRRMFGALVNAFTPPGSSFRTSDPDVVARAMNELAATDLTPALPRIRAPLTVVYASPDPRAGTAVDRTFRGAFAGVRGARFVRIDRSGHMVMLDQPARFEAAVRNFLAG